MAQIPAFDEKGKLEDTLSSQKLICNTYNTFANECANPSVKSVFMNILNEEHVIAHDVFCELQTRGWYSTPCAQQNKIDCAIEKFKKDL